MADNEEAAWQEYKRKNRLPFTAQKKDHPGWNKKPASPKPAPTPAPTPKPKPPSANPAPTPAPTPTPKPPTSGRTAGEAASAMGRARRAGVATTSATTTSGGQGSWEEVHSKEGTVKAQRATERAEDMKKIAPWMVGTEEKREGGLGTAAEEEAEKRKKKE